MAKINRVKFYRNLPFVDQDKKAPFLKKLFPFHFSIYNGFAFVGISIDLPFIACHFTLGKRLFK